MNSKCKAASGGFVWPVPNFPADAALELVSAVRLLSLAVCLEDAGFLALSCVLH